jgi:hypothetical protein
MSMTGTLSELNLADLIQLVCRERQCSRLTVENESGRAFIFIDDGEIIHAALGELEGRRALHRALAWDHGNFRLDNGIKATKKTIGGSSTRNLLEGMVRSDSARPRATGPPRERPAPFASSTEHPRRTPAAPSTPDRMPRAVPRAIPRAVPDAAPRAKPDPAPAPAPSPPPAADTTDLERLKRIPTVDHVVVVHKDGTAPPDAPLGQSEDECALTAFLGNAAQSIGKALVLGGLQHLIADIQGTPRVVLLRSPGYVGLHLNGQSEQATVAARAHDILEQGQ